MDFGFDEAQEDVRALSRRILDERATTERIREVEQSEERIDRALWRELAVTNLVGLALPEDVGGSGYGIMELAVLLEEVGRRVAPVPLLSTVGLGALPVAAFGASEARKRILGPVVDGSSLLTGGYREPHRHDALVPATTASRDGSRWRLEGTKVAAPHAPIADRIVVTAATGEGSVGAFVVDPAAPGVTVEPTWSTHRELQGTVVLDGAVVSDDDVLGDPEAGLDVAAWIDRHAIACLCATASGAFAEAVRITASYISEREQFGRAIATFQGATLRAADAFIDSEAVSVTTWSAIWRLAEGRPCDDELAIAKFWVAEGGQRVVGACQHLHGGTGVDVDYPIHRYFLWAKELELALGGASTHLLRLGGSLAGEPPEPDGGGVVAERAEEGA